LHQFQVLLVQGRTAGLAAGTAALTFKITVHQNPIFQQQLYGESTCSKKIVGTIISKYEIRSTKQIRNFKNQKTKIKTYCFLLLVLFDFLVIGILIYIVSNFDIRISYFPVVP